MSWNNLSIAQRSQLMGIFRRNGVTSLSEMKRIYDTAVPSEEPLDEFGRNTNNLYRSGGSKEQVRGMIQEWIAKNPTYRGYNTADFAEWLLETSGLESSFGKNLVGKKSDGTNSGYNGYFGLQVDSNAPFDTQMRKAFDKIHQILTDQITDYDLSIAERMGISQAQLLHKYWNQANRVTNYLHNGIDTTDGAGTRVSEYGNSDRLNMDYSNLVRPAIIDSTYTVKKGDTFSKIQSAVRVDGRNYNTAGEDLVKLQGEGFDKSNLNIGQTLTLIPRGNTAQQPKQEFIPVERPPKDKYYTRLNKKDEEAFQKWYYSVASANGLDPNPNDVRHSYDYRGYWKSATDEERLNAQQAGWHGTDTYKWPTHETFSTESKFYNPKTMQGVGHWEGEAFMPGSYNTLMKATKPDMEAFMKMIEANREHSHGGPIHIKESRKGTFTAAATKHGMGVQEFARHVSAHPEDFSAKMRKKAAFAKASAGWKHAHGGIKF